MKTILVWLRKHKFEIHSIAFILMIFPPILMYMAAESGHLGWIFPLLVPVIVGNLLLLAVK